MPLKKNGTKLYLLLSSINKEEYKRFIKFLKSPFFNSTPSLIRLTTLLWGFYPEFDDPKLSKEYIFKRVWGAKKKFNSKTIRDSYSDLSKKLEYFMVLQKLEAEKLEYDRILVNAFSKRNLYDLFINKVNSVSGDIKTNSVRSPEDYRVMAEFGQKSIFHPTHNVTMGEVEEVMHHLDRDFTLNKLRLYTLFRSKANFQSASGSANFVNEIMELTSQEYYREHIAFRLYSQMIMLQEDPMNMQKMKEVWELYIQSIDKLTARDQGNLFKCLLNYLIGFSKNILSQDPSSAEMTADYINNYLYDLYDLGFSKSIIIHNGEITDTEFTNMVVLGGKTGRLREVDQFIEEYKVYLSPRIRVSALSLAKAYLAYFKGDISTAISQLQSVQYENYSYKVKVRYFLLKLYVEQSVNSSNPYLSELKYLLESFLKFMTRDTYLSDTGKKGYIAFIRSIKALQRLRENVNTQKIDYAAYIESLDENLRREDRVWLVEMTKKTSN